jgi:arylsulfatase
MDEQVTRMTNVLTIVLDDTGFAQLGCFGSDIETPHLDALADDGLRYNRFHVTALCSPTRASLLTGRNHHRIGMGYLVDVPGQEPGYTAKIPPEAGTLAAVLKESGYSTMAVGKWHLAPRWENNPAGPYDRWPLGLGFERYYGFLGAETNQWTPALVRDNSCVEQPRSPEEGYHLSEDLADQAIAMIRDQQQNTPERPFFCYFATGAMHAPLQAPEEWVRRYEGRFDRGWDAWREEIIARQKRIGVVPTDAEPTERPPWVRPWDELDDAERRAAARGMEIFAAYLSYTDAQIGRVLDFLRDSGQLDDTLVLVLSDNGTSSEGGPDGSFNYHGLRSDPDANRDLTLDNVEEMAGHRAYLQYAWPWAWDGNTPFWLWKRFTALGGVRTPLIVHWPDGIAARGEVRDQFCHAVDLMPTVLDALGIAAPERLGGVEQMSLDGRSLVSSFGDPEAAAPRESQYFECAGSRSFYDQGWKIRTNHVGPTPPLERKLIPGSHDFDTDEWSLFHLDEDFAEATNLAGEHPDRLRRMVERWWTEAGRNNVLPLNDGYSGRAQAPRPAGHLQPARASYRPGDGAVSEFLHPVLADGFTMTAHLGAGADSASGVLFALGDWTQGMAWYLTGGRAVFSCVIANKEYRLAPAEDLTPGVEELTLAYRTEDGGGRFTLHEGDRLLGELEVALPLPVRWQIGGVGLQVGRDSGFPVSDDYAPPFALPSGVLTRLDVHSGQPEERWAEHAALAMATD